MLTQELVREYLDYDPMSGNLTWIKKPAKKIVIGSKAGSVKTAGNKRYLQVGLLGTNHNAHRVIWVWMTGEEPIVVDHEDWNGLNNKWSNLRNVTTLINGKNARLPSHNKSGIIGVMWDNTKQKWRVAIKVNGKTIELGYFHDKKIAAQVRRDAEIKYGFHKNHGSDRSL